MHDRTLGRAAFLGLVGAGVAGLFVGRDALGLLGRIVPDGVESIVPTSGWRIYTIGSSVPNLDPHAYRLTVGGAVERPLTYTLADLRKLPRAEQVSDFHCVTGWRVENVHWAGVRLRDVLAEAGLRPTAKALRFVSAEVPYDDTLTLPQAFGADVMLALEMDGEPLSHGHGFPARIVALQVDERHSAHGVDWVPHITYRYSVAGRHYQSSRVSFATLHWSSREQADAFLARYIGRADVQAYYDPRRPDQAFLEEPAGTLDPTTFAGVLMVALAVGTLLVYVRLR